MYKYLFAIKSLIALSLLSLVTVSIAWAQNALISEVPTLPSSPYNYEATELPNHFRSRRIRDSDNTPADNPITNEGAALGRVLFYDKRLSANHSISCASCHLQANAFADPAQFSIGFVGGHTGRNSMGLANARYYENGAFFWDERAASLEEQVLMPIQDSIEMGLTLEEMIARVSAESFYPPLFEAAFGTPEITTDRAAKAMAQFVRSMVSYQSKYDQGIENDFVNFTAQENMGRQLFDGRGRCDACHMTDLFILPEARNIGLDLVYADNGLGNVTGNTADNGKFKAPSLRNIALTAPYMHDGRFSTLADVVSFYNTGVQNHPNLDPRLRGGNGQPRRLNLNQTEQAALVAFLETLTDQALITDSKFSDPFQASQLVEYTVYLPIMIR